mmetsp:Transcript_162151/g.520016  ORF Transcript_162151/g.520016 Transcript_162151/m.520016 type:complete len:349 (+) Transcript_162151:71-1117(+)
MGSHIRLRKNQAHPWISLQDLLASNTEGNRTEQAPHGSFVNVAVMNDRLAWWVAWHPGGDASAADSQHIDALQPADQQFDHLEDGVQQDSVRPLHHQRGHRVARPLIEAHARVERFLVCAPQHDALEGDDREEHKDGQVCDDDELCRHPDLLYGCTDPRRQQLARLNAALDGGDNALQQDEICISPDRVQPNDEHASPSLPRLPVGRHECPKRRRDRTENDAQCAMHDHLQSPRLFPLQGLVSPTQVEAQIRAYGSQQCQIARDPNGTTEPPRNESPDRPADAVRGVEAEIHRAQGVHDGVQRQQPNAEVLGPCGQACAGNFRRAVLSSNVPPLPQGPCRSSHPTRHA